VVVALSVAVMLGAACSGNRSEETPAPSSSAEPAQTLGDDYAQMGAMYQRMADRYGRMGPAMAADARWMSEMHAQMTRLREYMPRMTGPSDGRGMGYGMMGHGMMGHRMGPGMMRGPGMSAMMGSWASGMDRWHDRMAERNEQWAAEAEQAGHPELAQLHRQIAELHRKAARDIETRAEPFQPPPSGGGAAQLDGAVLYAVTCAACHGARGQGAPGAFPALAGNPLLDGPADPIIGIVRSGKTGPLEVDGQSYNGVMPSFDGRLSSAQLAAILTYVRSAWGNHGGAVTAAQIERPGS
jgi:mono/diheme cytochrome c family protein